MVPRRVRSVSLNLRTLYVDTDCFFFTRSHVIEMVTFGSHEQVQQLTVVGSFPLLHEFAAPVYNQAHQEQIDRIAPAPAISWAGLAPAPTRIPASAFQVGDMGYDSFHGHCEIIRLGCGVYEYMIRVLYQHENPSDQSAGSWISTQFFRRDGKRSCNRDSRQNPAADSETYCRHSHKKKDQGSKPPAATVQAVATVHQVQSFSPDEDAFWIFEVSAPSGRDARILVDSVADERVCPKSFASAPPLGPAMGGTLYDAQGHMIEAHGMRTVCMRL